MRWRSGNPSLKAETFSVAAHSAPKGVMSLSGTVNRALMLFAIMAASAIWVWRGYVLEGMAWLAPLVLLTAVAGLAIGVLIAARKSWAPWLAPVYAILQGIVIGGISAVAEQRSEGIVALVASLTFGTLGCLLALYKSGLIKPSENFKLGVSSATGGIFLVYLAQFALASMGYQFGILASDGWLGFGFSLAVVVIAAFNLVLDFDFIEEACSNGCAKYMEWYAAYGLMVTLVWLYLELLRMLMSKDD